MVVTLGIKLELDPTWLTMPVCPAGGWLRKDEFFSDGRRLPAVEMS